MLLGQRLITCWVDRLQHRPCESCSLHCLYSRCGCLLDGSGRLCLRLYVVSALTVHLSSCCASGMPTAVWCSLQWWCCPMRCRWLFNRQDYPGSCLNVVCKGWLRELVDSRIDNACCLSFLPISAHQ